jgi:hypothetical protein
LRVFGRFRLFGHFRARRLADVECVWHTLDRAAAGCLSFAEFSTRALSLEAIPARKFPLGDVWGRSHFGRFPLRTIPTSDDSHFGMFPRTVWAAPTQSCSHLRPDFPLSPTAAQPHSHGLPLLRQCSAGVGGTLHER